MKSIFAVVSFVMLITSLVQAGPLSDQYANRPNSSFESALAGQMNDVRKFVESSTHLRTLGQPEVGASTPFLGSYATDVYFKMADGKICKVVLRDLGPSGNPTCK